MTKRKPKKSSGFKTFEMAHYCFDKDTTDLGLVKEFYRSFIKLQKYTGKKYEKVAETPPEKYVYCPKKPGCCWDHMKKEEKGSVA